MNPNKLKRFYKLRELQNTYEDDCQIFYPTEWDEEYLAYKFYQEHCINKTPRSSYTYEATVKHFYREFQMGAVFYRKWIYETNFEAPDPCIWIQWPMTPLDNLDNAIQTFHNEFEDFPTYDNFEFTQTFDNNQLDSIQTFDNQFESITTFDNQFDGIQTFDNQFESIQTFDNQFDGIQTFDNQFDGIQTFDNQLESIQTFDNQFEGIQTFDNQLESIQTFDNQFESIQSYYNEHFENVDQEDFQCFDLDYQFMENNHDTTQYNPSAPCDENNCEVEIYDFPRKFKKHHPPNLTLAQFLRIKSESKINVVNQKKAKKIRSVKVKCVNKRSYSNLGSIVHSTVHIAEFTSTQGSCCHLSEVRLINQSSNENVHLNDDKTCSQDVSSDSSKFTLNKLTTSHERVDRIPIDNPWVQIPTKGFKNSKAFSKSVACGSPKIISNEETASNEIENLKMENPSVHIATEKFIPSNTFQQLTTTWSKVVKGDKHTTTFVGSKTVKIEMKSNADTNSPKPRKVKFNKLSTHMEIIVKPEQSKEPVVLSYTNALKKQQPEFICYRTVPQQSKISIPTETESKYRSYKNAVVGVEKHSIVPDISHPQEKNDSAAMKINDHLVKPTNCAPESKVPSKKKEKWILKESRRKRSTKSKNVQ